MSVTSIHRPRVRSALKDLPQYPGHSADTANDDDRLLAVQEGFMINHAAALLLQLGADAIPELRAALGEARGLRRQAIVNALWHYRQAQDIPVFIEELQSGETNQRRQAATFLAAFNRPEIRDALTGALTDPQPIVRAAVIRSLRRSGAGLPQNLRPTLLRDPDPGVRQALIERTG
ncbi:HEAT repeat domain-containing protein [Ectothiorhodospiraceae bacterium WFHF3C12]|nr:HEAT repeat domain-containing protein [Ectothiorhodospiraceae bacterium WFHF3C12]